MDHRREPADGNELGEFLRTRRAGLDPRRAGLPHHGGLRRVPGLRREELAQLAHVSFDYVVRLEQGRTRRVSRAVLDALADALQMTPDERTYLFGLADISPHRAARAPGLPDVAPRLRQLLDDMHDVPAMIIHRRMDVLAWNRGAAALLTDFGALPPARRNIIRLTFLDDAFRSLYVEWPAVARECVAVLRMESGRHPGDPDLNALIAELNERSADFRTWWAGYHVAGARQLTKLLRHPTAGDLTVDVQQLSVDTHADQLLAAYTAHDAKSRDALGFLLRWSGDARRTPARRSAAPDPDGNTAPGGR
ncbi:helix-turn-helix domain-containing protein [Streptomyces sp. NPDC058603]|uniref:helix-turn-helix domain-containing protein n=1 Tax=unclassified Streptomyces TaxID=2593676 RepID=UPI00366A3E23